MKVAVVGAGIIALSTAYELSKLKNVKITVYADKFTPDTTSDTAVAIWLPYKAEPIDKVQRWCELSLETIREINKKVSASGIFWLKYHELYRENKKQPRWMDLASPKQDQEKMDYTPPPEFSCIHTACVPIIDSTYHMKFLLDFLTAKKIKLQEKHFFNKSEMLPLTDDIIINCTGLGAKNLLNDDELYPIKGEIIRVTKPDFDYAVADPSDNSLTYIIPRKNDCIIGGTAELNNWNMDVSKKTTNKIFERACRLCPSLKETKILEYKAGLRPARSKVRLELEKYENKNIIHNYGHGGAGFTLAYGCATDVAKLINKI